MRNSFLYSIGQRLNRFGTYFGTTTYVTLKLVSMGSSFYGSNDTRFSSKAGALEFAIVMNTVGDENGRAKVDYKEAKKLFDFICSNVSLPDVPRDSSDGISEVYSKMMEYLFKEKEVKDKGVQYR